MSKQPPSKTARAAATATWLLFAAAGVAFLWSVRAWTPGAQVAFATMATPTLTGWLLALGAALGSTMTLAIAAGGLVALSVPFFAGAKGSKGAKFYGALAAVALLAVGASWYGLKHQTERVGGQVGATAPR